MSPEFKTMKRIILFPLLLITFFAGAQVVPPTDVLVSITPLIPVSTVDIEDTEDPFSVLSDTASVNLMVIYTLSSILNMTHVHFEVGSTEGGSNVLDIHLPVTGDLPEGITRTMNNNSHAYNLGFVPYSGGLFVRVRMKDQAGNYSVFVSYP